MITCIMWSVEIARSLSHPFQPLIVQDFMEPLLIQKNVLLGILVGMVYLIGTLAHQDWHLMNVIGYANGPTKCTPAKMLKKRTRQVSFAPKGRPEGSLASMPILKIVANITSASVGNPGSMVVL